MWNPSAHNVEPDDGALHRVTYSTENDMLVGSDLTVLKSLMLGPFITRNFNAFSSFISCGYLCFVGYVLHCHIPVPCADLPVAAWCYVAWSRRGCQVLCHPSVRETADPKGEDKTRISNQIRCEQTLV